MLGRSRRESLGSPEPGYAGSPPISPCRAHPCPLSSWLSSQGGPKPGCGGVPALAAIGFGLSSTKEHIQKVWEEKYSQASIHAKHPGG